MVKDDYYGESLLIYDMVGLIYKHLVLMKRQFRGRRGASPKGIASVLVDRNTLSSQAPFSILKEISSQSLFLPISALVIFITKPQKLFS